MSFLAKLFGRGGGKSAAAQEAVAHDHKGFAIYVAPIKDTGGYRVAARIEKEINGELKSHQMIRADTVASLAEAEQISLHKAQTFVDQMGDGVFG
jgi:hypothetical protein